MDTTEAKEKLNGLIAKLPFIGLTEKIPAAAREKAPILNRAIPWANHIAYVLIAVVLIGGIASCGGKQNNPNALLKEYLKESGLSMAEFKKGLAEMGMTEKEFKETLVSAAKAAGSVSGGASAQTKASKPTGKNYTLSKETDFKYDLTQINGKDYVVIKDINLPANFEKPDRSQTVKNLFNASDIIDFMLAESANPEVIVDTVTLKIPAKIEGYTVGAISNLGYGKFIISVTLPDTVLEIGDGVFQDSSNLTSIKLPKNLKKIGSGAFRDSGIGGALTIPAGVTEIGLRAFNKTNITSVTIPAGVTEIGGFYGCKFLKEVTIPDSVTAIRSSAFEDCSELVKVKLPSHPIEYGSDAFSGCSKLSLAVRKTIQDSGYDGKF